MVVNLAALLVMFVGWRATQPSTACGSVIMNGDSPWQCIGRDQVFPGSPLGYWFIAGAICVMTTSVFLSRLIVRRARTARAREVVRPLVERVRRTSSD